MPTRKIADLPDDWHHWSKPDEMVRPCFHPEHDPPGHVVRKPGIYEHECPGCGRKVTFVVRLDHWLRETGPRRPENILPEDDSILPWHGGCSAPWR